MIYPPFLREGDKVGLVATAGKIPLEKIENGKAVLSSWGLNVTIAPHAGDAHHGFAGTDKDRLDDFQQMLDDHEIKAVFCLRGGYGTVRIIKNLNIDGLKNNPKWVIGFSDITILHSLLGRKSGLVTLHAVMPINYPNDGSSMESMEILKNTLFGKPLKYQLVNHPSNLPGEAEGTLTGGNLTVLNSLRGTDIDLLPSGSILFIEDVGEFAYHIDRMLMNFDTGRVFDKISGLVIGAFSDIKYEKFDIGKSVLELVIEKVADKGIPVIADFPAGHVHRNLPLLLNTSVKMIVNNEGAELDFI